MKDSPRKRATTFLWVCGAQIAPYWKKQYSKGHEPVEVSQFLDTSVANILQAEPDLWENFKIGPNEHERLASTLREIVTRAARTETERLRKVDKRNEKLARIAFRDQKRVKQKQEAEARDQTRQARLAGQEAIRKAQEEERNGFIERVTAHIAGFPALLNDEGSITKVGLDLVLADLADAMAFQWRQHGGQEIGDDLFNLNRTICTTLMHGVRHNTDEWDFRRKDGSLYRFESLPALVYRTSKEFSTLVLKKAKPNFTYELQTPWLLPEVEELLHTAVTRQASTLGSGTLSEQGTYVSAESLTVWQDSHPAPPLAPYGVSPAGAERWCRDWLEYMGVVDATVTQQSNDGGVDVVSMSHIAQVKHYVGSVSIAELRELAGVAALDGQRTAIFMTSGKYPSQAAAFADQTQMLLYRYDVVTGTVAACNQLASTHLQSGFFPHTSNTENVH